MPIFVAYLLRGNIFVLVLIKANSPPPAARWSLSRRPPASVVQDWMSRHQDYRGTLIEPGTINKKQSNAVDWCVDTMDLWYGNALVCTSG